LFTKQKQTKKMKTEDDVVVIIYDVLGLNKTKIKCNATIHRIIRSYFGFSPNVVAAVWNKIIDTCTLVKSARIKHLLWMLAYFKSYNEYEFYLQIFTCSKPTFMSWVWYFAKVVAELEVVSTITKKLSTLFYTLTVH
jgi:hypothetical protein